MLAEEAERKRIEIDEREALHRARLDAGQWWCSRLHCYLTAAEGAVEKERARGERERMRVYEDQVWAERSKGLKAGKFSEFTASLERGDMYGWK